MHTAAVRHSELSGVVHQPPAGRGAAVPGRGELRGRRQLCLRESSFTSPQLQTSAAVFIDTLQQRADIVFLLSCRVRAKWQCLPRQLFSCVGAVFRNSCKTPTSLFSPRFHSTNIPLSSLLCLRNSFFSHAAYLYRGPPMEGVTTVESRLLPGLVC